MQTCDFVLFLVEFFMAMGLFVVANLAENIKNPKWKLLYLVPFFFVIVMLVIGEYEASMLPVYFAGLLCMVGFFCEKKAVRKGISVMAVALALITNATVACNPGYREVDYVEEFEDAFSTLKEHYVLGEYKGIDWDTLYARYHEKFQDVKKQHDPVQNIITWKQFCYEFHDGHVAYVAEEADLKRATERVAGNDYGLSLLTLSNGDTVAVNVEENSAVYDAGIRNGTVITAWNGKDLSGTFEKVDMSILGNMPLKENEDFYRGILAAGTGGEINAITFLDEKGEEQTVEAHSLGNYYDRLVSTMNRIDQGVEASNLAFKEVAKDTYVLRIKQMQYDTTSYENGDHSEMQNELRNQLNELKEQGVNHLIIDIRGNGGGSPQMIIAIAQLFSPVGEYSYAWEGVFDKKSASYVKEENGKYKVGEALCFVGENVWENRRVTLLVNAQSISAADHFAYLLGMLKLDNVTIMGFHKTNSSGQAISGIPLTNGMITYSCIPTLTKEGDIMIDPDVSREGGVSLDKQIPFDQEAVKAIFDDGEDYLLKKALEE